MSARCCCCCCWRCISAWSADTHKLIQSNGWGAVNLAGPFDFDLGRLLPAKQIKSARIRFSASQNPAKTANEAALSLSLQSCISCRWRPPGPPIVKFRLASLGFVLCGAHLAEASAKSLARSDRAHNPFKTSIRFRAKRRIHEPPVCACVCREIHWGLPSYHFMLHNAHNSDRAYQLMPATAGGLAAAEALGKPDKAS